MVGGTVAFDAQQVATGALRVRNGQVDEKSGDADLMVDLVAAIMQRPPDLFLQDAVVVEAGLARHVKLSGPGVMQEQLQGKHAFALAPLEVNVLVRNGSEHLASALGSADQNVQA